ncbi:MAG: helix-turn-helix transcriptional regulator [Longimicrobiales bacterium]
MDGITMPAGETRTRLLRLVRGGPRSIGELAGALGISANAVRTHVAALERDGLVGAASRRRSTGGKPAQLYELTPAGEELFPKAYALVLTELVAALREADGERAADELLRRVGRRLGAGVRPPGGAGEAAVAAAAGVLESIGGAVEVSAEAGGWRIRSAGCPLSRVVAESAEVCALAESLVEQVTGRRVVERCDRSGTPRCSFHVFDEPSPTAAG